MVVCTRLNLPVLCTSDVVLRPVLVLRPFFEVLAKAVLVLVLTLDGFKDLKNCGLKTKNVLRPFLNLKDLKILILDEAKF